MSDNQKISDELITKYIENKVTAEERKLVLVYLMKNPDEIESILIQTNAMLLDDEDQKPTFNLSSAEGNNTYKINDIIYSAAAFAPLTGKENKQHEKLKKRNPEAIWARLENLSQELKKQ